MPQTRHSMAVLAAVCLFGSTAFALAQSGSSGAATGATGGATATTTSPTGPASPRLGTHTTTGTATPGTAGRIGANGLPCGSHVRRQPHDLGLRHHHLRLVELDHGQFHNGLQRRNDRNRLLGRFHVTNDSDGVSFGIRRPDIFGLPQAFSSLY